MKFEVELTTPTGKSMHSVELARLEKGYAISLNGRPVAADVVQIAPYVFSVLLAGHSFELHIAPAENGILKLQYGPHEFSAEVDDPRAWKGRKHSTIEIEGQQQIVAPMPGKVVRLLVKAGDVVQAGQGLLVIEAMKMQNEIRSPKTGKVERMLAEEGQTVTAGKLLAVVG
jgi:biotin carboxyl carrier protein